ncbi:MAG TPA: F0F1 ATP synthase subunit A [Gemmatimonadales bacterium]|nr:F0F1 ATP synthase subunit A [Gemmatimonadales bacterium]
MNRLTRGIAIVLALAFGAGAAPVVAQGPAAPEHAGVPSREIDIMHHLGNAHAIEYPCFKPGLTCEAELPQWKPVQVGPLAIDFSPTKHLVWMLLATVLALLMLLLVARSVARAEAAGRPATGFAGAVEAIALWVRQEVIVPNVGHHGEGYVPYLLSLFFFILFSNLLGLLPYGAPATGNIAVTGALALLALVVIEISGMRSLGTKGYLGTIFFVPHGLPGGIGGAFMKGVLLIIMTPIEIIGKLAKPFALAVRLFANMTAGHVVILALLGLTFFFHSYTVGVGASALATGIMLLELFVAFLHAFVFTLLTSVFIGLIRTSH